MKDIEMEAETRTESDAYGAVEIPVARYWGAQTARALEVFSIGEEHFPPVLLRALGLQKAAAARANRRLGELRPEIADAIDFAAREVAAGRFDADFPLTIWQTGSGTQTNMNANEVIANRANELLGHPLGARSPVHPNDHVNRSQSSNDSFPTVMHVAVALALRDSLHPALVALQQILDAKATQFADAVKIGRTHLMDAVPMTVGQAFGTFSRQVAAGRERIDAAAPSRLLKRASGSGQFVIHSAVLSRSGSGARTGQPKRLAVFLCGSGAARSRRSPFAYDPDFGERGAGVARRALRRD